MIGEGYWCLWLIGANKKLGNAKAVDQQGLKFLSKVSSDISQATFL